MTNDGMAILIFPSAEELELVNEFRRGCVITGANESVEIIRAMREFVDRHGPWVGILRSGEFREYVYRHLKLELDGATVKSWHGRRWTQGVEYYVSQKKNKTAAYAYDVRRCWPWVCEYARKKGKTVGRVAEKAPERDFGVLIEQRAVTSEGEVKNSEVDDPVKVYPMGDLRQIGWNLGTPVKKR